MLLTSSQVSIVLSSGIIFIFTFLLFISGYVLQQRTVQSLQTAIRPRDPIPRHKPPLPDASPINLANRHSRPFGRLRDRAKLQAHLSSLEEPFDWSKLAYAQFVRDHAEVCNALIFFADLHRFKSPVPRLLLFPRAWVAETEGETPIPFLETSRRLLKKASRIYRVILVPIDPVPGRENGSDPSQYSLASLFSLTKWERVLSFPPPGLILNPEALDSVLAFSDTSTIAAYPSLNSSSSLSSLLLIKPSMSTFKTINHIHASSVVPDIDLLADLFPAASPLLSDSDTEIYTTTSTIRTAANFNATAFLTERGFVFFQDSEIPGPEYDIPYPHIVKMRPKDDDQGFLWEKMYSTYKDRRYGVCGLDLEAWPPVAKAPAPEKRPVEVNDVSEKSDL